jgi:hypothetical protein
MGDGGRLFARRPEAVGNCKMGKMPLKFSLLDPDLSDENGLS